MSEEEVPSHLAMLNPEQYRAVTTTEGPLLILAGAGSGKTRVLTRRVAHLLHKGVDPKNILAVTFTNKAAAEMKERIIELVGEAGEKVWVSTFHASCCRILRSDIEVLGFTRRYAIYDDDDQLRLLKEIMLRENLDPKITSARDFRSKIDHHKTRMVTPDMLISQRKTHINSTLLRVWREYEQNLQAADALDFNDLICKTVQLFAEHPDVLSKWRSRFVYVMVDEYQDTNQQQYDLLRLLCPDADSNLGVVGDDDQSIYGFRGADISNIMNFTKDYASAAVIKLEQNYRCSGNILNLANVVVAKNTGRFDKRLWTDAPAGAKVKLVRCGSPADEASKVAGAISRAQSHLNYEFGDIAVIYRTNATSRVFEKALVAQSIPYKIVGGQKFYALREIRDVLSYLRLIVNLADDAALLRIINVPTRGIGTKALSTLRESAEKRGVPLLAAARGLSKGSTKAAGKMRAFVEIMDTLTEAARRTPPADLVSLLLEASGYIKSLEGDKRKDERLANLKALITDAGEEVAPQTDAWGDPIPVPAMDALRAWLDRVALAGQTDEIPDGGQVTLMTVHCSKGLEYPVVFVVHMMQGIFPHSKSQEEGMDEERRLAYVAFTRAKDILVITRSQTMPVWSNAKAIAAGVPQNEGKIAPPSDFLYGLPPEATAGDVPRIKAEVVEDPRPKAAVAKRKAFLNTQTQFHTHHQPEGDYTLYEVCELSDLRIGALVRHSRKGFGLIRRVNTAGGVPRVNVDFGGASGRTATVSGTELEVVVE